MSNTTEGIAGGGSSPADRLEHTYPSYDAFVADRPGRRAPVYDVGSDFACACGPAARISWVPPTAEVVATLTGQGDGPVEVLGTVPDFELVRALLLCPDRQRSLAWARQRIRQAPHDPAGAAAVITSVDEAWRNLARDMDRARRAAFRPLDLWLLPDPDPLLGRSARPCECRDCHRADWSQVARASLDILRGGIDPLDVEAVRRAARRLLPGDAERDCLIDLFRSPIEGAGRDYRNGRHRVHAMLRSEVRHCAGIWTH